MPLVFVQEAHGFRHGPECLGKVFPDMVWHSTFCDSPGAGGCIIGVKRERLGGACSVMHEHIAVGRVHCLQLGFADGGICLINVHLVPNLRPAQFENVCRRIASKVGSLGGMLCVMGVISTSLSLTRGD